MVEDFTPKLDAALARCPASYDLCYVGAICRACWGIFCIRSTIFWHALVLLRHQRFIADLDCHPAIEANLGGVRNVIDNWYANELQPRGNCYVCTSYLAAQSSGFSDIAKEFNANGSYADYVWR